MDTDASAPILKPYHRHHHDHHNSPTPVKASDALPLPLYLTNGLFFGLFFSVAYFLLHRWREKIRNSTPLHIITFPEIVGIVCLAASIIYLLGFFGIGFVQSCISRGSHDSWDVEEDNGGGCSPEEPPTCTLAPISRAKVVAPTIQEPFLSGDDDEVIKGVVSGTIPSYSLESKLGDCKRAAAIRREALQRMTGRSMEGLPLEGFDYESILGQCCEMPVGFVQIPVGIAGPLLLNGKEYMVPMATTEGCLVASTNRGCKAIYASGGASSVLLKDAMTRAPVVRFGTAKRAAELKFFVEDPANFDTLSVAFNRSSRFGRLQNIKCTVAGKNLYMRFGCSTGDAMGMNMVSKGVQNVLDYLQPDFPDMEIIGISGNYCSDKKPAAVNWIEGRGKSVVCEAIINEEVVKKVLKTNIDTLVELNMLKNLTGSAMAGALGGFNAHASNIVSAVFIATGQDPAQNVESSHCITMMESVNDGKDLHISVTMPSIEVGTVGGGTQLASQSACLNLLGVKGASKDSPGSNSRLLASIVAGSVLAGELSLMSAIAAGQLVRSHMKYNRSSKDVAPPYESPYSAVEVSLPLTFLDIIWLKFHPLERIFSYELTDLTPTVFNSEILPKLKNSLSLTLLRFLPVAGNITWPSHSAKPIILYTPQDGVSLTVAESNNAADFDDLSSNEMHDAIVSHPYVPRLSASDKKVPVLALQITLFPNKGFSIGCAVHHAALDGKSSILFMKAWAHLCKNSSCLLPAELIPFFDRTAFQDPEGIDIECLNSRSSSMNQADGGSDSNARSLKPIPPTEVEPNSARATFNFSREDIRKLRERILSQLDKVSDRKDAEPIHLSSFAITLSYALVCLVKARGLKSDEKMMFGFAADCRARLDPPIPTNYSGNCISFCADVLIAGPAMQDDGILFVARKVSELIKGIEKTTLEVEKDKVEKFMVPDLDAPLVGVAGSARFEVYGVDFGWGRPKNVEVTSIDRTGAISMAESKADSGGVEIGLVLKKDVMGIFKNLKYRFLSTYELNQNHSKAINITLFCELTRLEVLGI
uniref:3-hydroxy-3-methylglutaryl coenzyme A reductase n=1 Tax=Salix viminalis TaxID=40686 RepID=A0A6N2N4E5_SALVM